ncbi:MAG: cytochrome C oxidase subunit IV family protein [Planctomycetota bacterium]
MSVRASVRSYLAVFAALVGLTILAVSGALGSRGPLAIAVLKAALVALYFMHLKDEGRWLRGMTLGPILLLVVLIILLWPDFTRTS